MQKISKDNIHNFAFTNERALAVAPRLVYFQFHGLGQTALFPPDALSERDKAEGARGILRVHPYYGPWSWMNAEAVRYVDAVRDAVFERHGLPAGFPVVSTGGSMGGLSCLVYALCSKHTPAAIAANCPVCDLPYHATERPDLPRTMYSAFAHYAGGIEAGLESASPLHQAGKMPRIPCLIVHSATDASVNKAAHSDKFVAAMRAASRPVEYIEVPVMPHCALDTVPAVEKRYHDFIYSFAKS
ncbi:MAG: prolyl oligopeptidase family serine peptidase [Opitutaceae bacterium]|jgi:pimeloyl-ACP methyl ester carboxylesterase|nr:prolyl oligopeptidase family serine peptidase [Opitutaceae bacterium]